MSFTADQDNAGVNPELLAAARAALQRHLPLEPAGPKDQVIFKQNKAVAPLADRIIALAHEDSASYWVLQNDWSGFPDPSEYVLVGFRGQAEIFALGYFEDWPSHWTHPQENKDA